MDSVRGSVEKIFVDSEDFCAGQLRTHAGALVDFAGPVRVRVRELVALSGHWVAHPTHGRQLRTQSAAPVELHTVPERALDADAFERAHRPTRRRSRASLAEYGLSDRQLDALTTALGPEALTALHGDPYRLLQELPGLSFARIDAVALRSGIAADARGRVRAGLLHCLDEALEQGDCWLERDVLLQRAHERLGLDCADGFERLADALDTCLADGTLVRAAHGEGGAISRTAIDDMERELAGFLADAWEPNPHFAELGADELDALLAAARDAEPAELPPLGADQQHALRLALRHRIALLCGAAGTGKTRTVAALAELCAQRGLDVILAAPTGKAARRLEEVADREAMTVHRLLGFTGRVYLRGPQSPVLADVLIVDELSMMNLALAWQLFRSLDARRTAVLLVGDPAQLPPIGPGNPLRDLVATGAVPTVTLEAIVRQAGVLKTRCLDVLCGEIGPEAEPWQVHDGWVNAGRARAFLLELVERLLREDPRARSELQVLTPMHRGPLGTRELNRLLQRLVQRVRFGIAIPETTPGAAPQFLLHDRVIQMRNDYELGVMNGSIGRVLDVGPAGALRVEFEDRTVELEPRSESREQLQLAYALTVHKTQGSEFEQVIAVVHRAHAFMHHRNWLYTAVTRARQRVFLIGDRLALESCAEKHLQDQRRTRLDLRLRAQLRGSAPGSS